MARYRLALLVLLAAVAAGAAAQSNQVIDTILGQEHATLGSAAYLALSGAGIVPEQTAPALAVAVAVESGWLPPESDAAVPATFGQAAYLLMQAYGVSGGLMYRVFAGPRYAAREFAYHGWSPERRFPNERISGEFLVRVTGNFLDMTEASR